MFKENWNLVHPLDQSAAIQLAQSQAVVSRYHQEHVTKHFWYPLSQWGECWYWFLFCKLMFHEIFINLWIIILQNKHYRIVKFGLFRSTHNLKKIFLKVLTVTKQISWFAKITRMISSSFVCFSESLNFDKGCPFFFVLKDMYGPT